jgi:hypothetical protein
VLAEKFFLPLKLSKAAPAPMQAARYQHLAACPDGAAREASPAVAGRSNVRKVWRISDRDRRRL